MDRIWPRRQNGNVVRLRRRKNATALIYRNLSKITTALLATGYLWMTLIPIPPLSQGVYIDENALQPAQVNTNWNWQDVHQADLYLHHLEGLRDKNATSEQRASFIRDEFAKLGLSAATQNYTFMTPSSNITGINAYAILNSPRTPGSEAIVISASWLSEVGKEPYNLRGIATVIALAGFLKNYSLWAKDIIFVIGDNYLDGIHAWLNAYHGTIPQNLDTDLLELTSGVIWNALNVDYSGHSFSHLGVFFEGLNGRLPNQDLINSLRLISHYTAGVPLVLYDHLELHDAPQNSLLTSAPEFMKRSPQLREFEHRARNVKRHVSYQARGRPSAPHGLFHRFRIDAITLYAIPADGPHGFFALGRIIESTLRTSNNLLERLHASFFFYILTTPATFMKIGTFLPSAVLVAVAMIFSGLGRWVEAGWVQESSSELQPQGKEDDGKAANATIATVATLQPTWRPRQRPVIPVITTICVTHCIGLLAFAMIDTSCFLQNQVVASWILLIALGLVPQALLTIIPSHPPETAPFSLLLQSFNLCLASTVISITSLLNFSLAATLAVTLGIPLICSHVFFRPSQTSTSHFNKPCQLAVHAAYWVLTWGWLLLPQEVEKAVWNWEVLGVWFAPFVCIVYAPLLMQAGLVGLSVMNEMLLG
ncbi:Gaa1-like protein [Boletus edulis BED1]|uniref:Gaa1-like protein n=1 Tax=Boletus edulis BED1 TaxID=1328754 RepID=A0AAD4GJD9_BOLED|nr:Gaa1-like protein [Boletus edulis BED1]